MAPVTRSREGKKESSPTVAGRRKGAGGVKKKETIRLPVAGKRKGAGVKKKETIGQAVRGQTSTGKIDYARVQIPVIYANDDGACEDDDYFPPPRTYPDRKTVMEKVSFWKKEAECKEKFEALNTFVKKNTGLTYDEAITQLATRGLTSKKAKVITPQICVYLTRRFGLSNKVMRNLYSDVEVWDREVIVLLFELLDNVKKIRPSVPGLDTVFSVAKSVLDKGQPSIAVFKDAVWGLALDMIFIDSKMKRWSKSPTLEIDVSYKSDLFAQSRLVEYDYDVPLSYFN